jgi:hypothetical protein
MGKGWWCGSSGRAPALRAQGPKFKPHIKHTHKKQNNLGVAWWECLAYVRVWVQSLPPQNKIKQTHKLKSEQCII